MRVRVQPPAGKFANTSTANERSPELDLCDPAVTGASRHERGTMPRLGSGLRTAGWTVCSARAVQLSAA